MPKEILEAAHLACITTISLSMQTSLLSYRQVEMKALQPSMEVTAASRRNEALKALTVHLLVTQWLQVLLDTATVLRRPPQPSTDRLVALASFLVPSRHELRLVKCRVHNSALGTRRRHRIHTEALPAPAGPLKTQVLHSRQIKFLLRLARRPRLRSGICYNFRLVAIN